MQARLERLYDTGKVKESDIDVTTFDALEGRALDPYDVHAMSGPSLLIPAEGC